MNPILLNKTKSLTELLALKGYLKYLDITFEVFLEELIDMTESDYEQFVEGYNIFLQQMQKAMIENIN